MWRGIPVLLPNRRVPHCGQNQCETVLPAADVDWNSAIVPEVSAGKKVILAAHGNSLRALVKFLDNMSDQDVVELNIPTGVPLVYELDAALKPIRHYYLGDQARIEAAVKAVAAQGKASA